LNAIGFLGASLVILCVLGYTSVATAVIGGLLVAVSTYSMYLFHQDIAIIAYSLAYQTSALFDDTDEEDN
jgi:hypothetical protein